MPGYDLVNTTAATLTQALPGEDLAAGAVNGNLLLQVDLGPAATATVVINGRVSPNAAYFLLKTLTTNFLGAMVFCSDIQVVVTGNTPGNKVVVAVQAN